MAAAGTTTTTATWTTSPQNSRINEPEAQVRSPCATAVSAVRWFTRRSSGKHTADTAVAHTNQPALSASNNTPAARLASRATVGSPVTYARMIAPSNSSMS